MCVCMSTCIDTFDVCVCLSTAAIIAGFISCYRRVNCSQMLEEEEGSGNDCSRCTSDALLI